MKKIRHVLRSHRTGSGLRSARPLAAALVGILPFFAAVGCSSAPSTDRAGSEPVGTSQSALTVAGDLSNTGGQDFDIGFTLSTTQSTGVVGLVGQRSVCGYGYFWDIRLTNGQMTLETDGGSSSNYYVTRSTANVADGNAHLVEIRRNSGSVTIYVDTIPTGTSTSSAFFGPMAAAATGIYGCVDKDVTVPLTGSITNVSIEERPVLFWTNTRYQGGGYSPSVANGPWDTLEFFQSTPTVTASDLYYEDTNVLDENVTLLPQGLATHQAFPGEGWKPQVALAGDALQGIEVHEGSSNDLYISTVNTNAPSSELWSGSSFYASGVQPAVAVVDIQMLEVHQTGTGPTPLSFTLALEGLPPSATINTIPEITWGPTWSQAGIVGEQPKLAMAYRQVGVTATQQPASFAVVLVYQAGDGEGPLYMSLATITAGLPVTWSPPFQFANGQHPSVAICHHPGVEDTLTAVSETNGQIAFWQAPIAAGATVIDPIRLRPAIGFTTMSGANPSVSCYNDVGFETHQVVNGASGWVTSQFVMQNLGPFTVGPTCSGTNMGAGCSSPPPPPAPSNPVPPAQACSTIPFCVSCESSGLSGMLGNYCSMAAAVTAWQSNCLQGGGCDPSCFVEQCN